MEPDKNWTDQEKWIYEKLLAGEGAHLNEYSEGGGDLDPKEDECWPDARELTERFLKDIVLLGKYSKALPHQGIRIIGAWFKESIDLSNADLIHQLMLKYSKFDAHIDSPFLKTEYTISFEGSHLTSLNLLGAKIGGQLNMNSSMFDDNLVMESLEVKDSLFMGENAKFDKTINLSNATIGGQLAMNDSRFNGEINMECLEVGQNLILINSIVKKPINIIFAKIGGGLQLSASKLNSLDLTGATIKKDLALSISKSYITEWKEGSQLSLRNVTAGVLNAFENSWPDEVDLTGFIFSRIGGYSLNEERPMDISKVTWFKGWLEKQRQFSPQPYEHLGNLLMKGGYETKAKEIFYAGRERNRTEAIKRYSRSWWWQCLQRDFIGYGYYNERALKWILLFTLIGTFVFFTTGVGIVYGIPYGFSYSLDMILPIIRLRELHYTIYLHNPYVRYYFYFHQIMGYILASFLIAGLAGLTRR